MKRFLVLKNRSAQRGDDVTLVHDGFQPFAVVLPVVWLLWNRLWLQAAIVFAVTALATLAASILIPPAMPFISSLANFATGMITAHEGGTWRAADLQRKGHILQDIILAGSPRDAELVYAARQTEEEAPLPKPVARGFQPVSQSSLIPLTGA